MRLHQSQEYKGLNLESDVDLTGNVAAIVGRNGAGKSRLLRAIAEGSISVTTDAEVIPRNRMLYLEMDKLQPSLVFHHDPVRHAEDLRVAITMYQQNRGKFHANPEQSINSLGNTPTRRGAGVTPSSLCHAVSVASRLTGKDVNDLDDDDVADFYSPSRMLQFGGLNVTAIVRSYLDRQERNELNLFRNTTKGRNLPYWDDESFVSRFGPPPWDVLNNLLNSVLDGNYYFTSPPPIGSSAAYESKLCRKDGLEVDVSLLSSGERTLLWLILIMYGAGSLGVMLPPKLLLLDEPDGTLHPQMIQKLHAALEMLAREFQCNIIFSTHSPTTVALFGSGDIYQISETKLAQVEKDAAISELLVGVDQVSIHYTNRRQVYVESHADVEIYSTLFHLLKLWNKLPSPHISLSFSAAAPKLADSSIRQIVQSVLGAVDAAQLDALSKALNGQGNCAQVIGVVEGLTQEGNQTVHGIIDWDQKNQATDRVHVLGPSTFYAIENAILNPLTLGLYLLANFPEKLEAREYGLNDGYDIVQLLVEYGRWQDISDAVTRRVLGVSDVAHEIRCVFDSRTTLHFDSRYVHKNGHSLDSLVKATRAFPFLSRFQKQNSLMMDVIRRSIQTSQGRTLPSVFADAFGRIQRA